MTLTRPSRSARNATQMNKFDSARLPYAIHASSPVMRSALLWLLLGLLLVPSALAQPDSPATGEPVHEMPFASEGNVVALTVAGTSEGYADEPVRVRLSEAPAWLSFRSDVQTLDAVENEAEARFRFDVGAKAPVGTKERLRFAVEDAKGRVLAEKVIRVKTAAPEAFTLVGNWPNPFHDATQIGYRLPAPAEVTVYVYDTLGQRVERIDAGRREAGSHTARLHAGRLASGVYFYRVAATLAGGERQQQTGRMVLVR